MGKQTKLVISKQGRRDKNIVLLLRLFSALSAGVSFVSVIHMVMGAYRFSDTSLGGDISVSLVVVAVVSALCAGVFAGLDVVYGGRAAVSEERRIRSLLLKNMYEAQSLPKNEDEDFTSARLIQLMTDNTERSTEYYQRYLGTTIAALLVPFIALGYIALAYDVVTGLVIMALCPLVPLCVLGFLRIFRSTSSHSRKQRAILSGKYIDALRNLVTIRLHGAAPRMEEYLREQGEKNRLAIMKILAGNQIVIIVLDGVFSLVFIVLSSLVGLWRYESGHLSLTGLFVLVLFMVLLIEPLAQVAGFFYVGMGGMASMRAIAKYKSRFYGDEYVHTEKKNTANTYEAKESKNEDIAIDIQNLSYDYGRGEVLHNITMSIPQGKKVGIIGKSGSGKTTLLSLLKGALPVQKGDVLFRGRHINEMTPEQIRCYSAIVSQSTWLFTDTIANNLRLAFPDATEEQMWNALEKAHVAKDVRNMPDGLDTWLGEGGRLVSGGQAQRIAIARALLSGRKILLLDEPTSQVDIESEKYIIQALEEFDETWTIICVTHRSSLLCVVDEVWRMDSGILERVEKEDIQLLTEEDNDGKN